MIDQAVQRVAGDEGAIELQGIDAVSRFEYRAVQVPDPQCEIVGSMGVFDVVDNGK